MTTALLNKMQKWHSFCALKGINVDEDFYSILEITELIDRLQSEIENNEFYYQAALECRRMQISRDQIDWYRDHLEKIYQEKEEARKEQEEEDNPTLKILQERNEFKFVRHDDHNSKCELTLFKGKEKLSVTLLVEKETSWRYSDRWKISYSWYDRGLSQTRNIKWNPRTSSVKCPSWFPAHWKKSENISCSDHMAFFVAWKLVNNKAGYMGGNPSNTKVSTSMKPIEDIVRLKHIDKQKQID